MLCFGFAPQTCHPGDPTAALSLHSGFCASLFPQALQEWGQQLLERGRSPSLGCVLRPLLAHSRGLYLPSGGRCHLAVRAPRKHACPPPYPFSAFFPPFFFFSSTKQHPCSLSQPCISFPYRGQSAILSPSKLMGCSLASECCRDFPPSPKHLPAFCALYLEVLHGIWSRDFFGVV